MEITTPISALLLKKPGHIWTTTSDTTVFNAIAQMAEKDIGALPVLEDGKLVGMISERDYTRKVILLGRSSQQTAVAAIMTRNPVTVGPRDSVQVCMERMTVKRVRHLPVVENDRLLGLVSIGDLVNWTIQAQDAAIEDLRSYVTGAMPARS